MKTRGFTLIELLVVISIIGVLSTVVLGSLSSAKLKGRDAKRIAEIRQMQTALQLYFNDNGVYPNPDYAGCGSWDTPGNGTFLTALASGNYMPNISDPTTNDSCGNYRYYRYPAGYTGCPLSRGAFYVLGIGDMESTSGTHPRSPGWSCGSRDWQLEFEWVTGQYEN